MTHIFSHYYNYELSKRLEDLKSLELVEKGNASITLCFYSCCLISTLQFLDLRTKIAYNSPHGFREFSWKPCLWHNVWVLGEKRHCCFHNMTAQVSFLGIYVTYPFLRYFISPIILHCYSYPFKNHYFSE